MIEKNWLDLKKPDELEIKQSEYNPRQAVIEVGPFERGFGVTIGNALRRVLLSSLQGSAISAVQIQGVVHEFSSIPGVREDVTDLVLNLKGVAVRVDDDSPKRLRLAAEGPATVTAGMISESAGVEIMNPDHVLCQLDKGASVSMELTVTSGKGYVPAGSMRTEDSPIGLIPIDAIYSPVSQVAYKVDNARVGQITDYDKLLLTVETDGSVTPEDAVVAYAARILQEQLQPFINFEEPKEQPSEEDERGSAVQPQPASQGRRTGTFGPFGELPEERQHRLYWRSGAKDRVRNASYSELRSQVAERDQGSPQGHESGAWHGYPCLAAGECRGACPPPGRTFLGSD